MRKLLCVFLLYALSTFFCGCGAQALDEPVLAKTLKSQQGDIVISVPDNWVEDSVYMDIMVLKISDNISAYAQVYYLAYDEQYLTLDDFLDERLIIYSDDFTGEVQTLEIGGMAAKKFEYIYEDFTENFEEAKFHGFEYLIDAPKGVVYIDIYNTLINPKSETDEVSTPQQRRLLESIAESVRIGKTESETGGET